MHRQELLCCVDAPKSPTCLNVPWVNVRPDVRWPGPRLGQVQDRRRAVALSSPSPGDRTCPDTAPTSSVGRPHPDGGPDAGPGRVVGMWSVSNYFAFESRRTGEDCQCAFHQRTVALRSGMMFASIPFDTMVCRCRQSHPITHVDRISLKTELTYLAQVGLLWQHVRCSLQVTNRPARKPVGLCNKQFCTGSGQERALHLVQLQVHMPG